ncbi:MAG: cadherin-like beta sandwich domain-containing protein, partial [Acidimicrobiaceae bacterium]|nr:cadherin-like beta sandwich domain-containing protein [Acidimicrobiaceae bacterium]
MPPPPTRLTVSLDSTTVAEDAGEVTVTATFNKAVNPTTITFSAGGGEATKGTDYVVPEMFTAEVAQSESSATVTLTITDDDIDEADETFLLQARGLGLTSPDLEVTITDNDDAAVTVDQTARSVVVGSETTYTVVLGTQPTDSVTVTPSSSATDVAGVSAALVFTRGNWNAPQTMTVRGLAEGTATVTHAATSEDSAYDEITISSVDVTVNAAPGVIVSETARSVVVGGESTYTVELGTQPSDSVTVTPSSSATDVAGGSAALVFTTGDWDTPQTVTVRGLAEGTATVTHAATSNDNTYNGITIGSVDVTVVAAPTALTLTTDAPSGSFAEGSGDGTVTVTATLDKAAAGTGVEVTLAAGALSSATENEDFTLPAPFTIAAGERSATAELLIIDDKKIESNETLVLTATASGLAVTDATLTITDNDAAGLVASELHVTLGPNATAQYTIALAAEPTAAVTVAARSTRASVATVTDEAVFTTADWETPKTLTVSGVGGGTAKIIHRVSTTDPNYSGLGVPNVAVTVERAFVSNLGQSHIQGQGLPPRTPVAIDFTTGSGGGGFVLAGISAQLQRGAQPLTAADIAGISFALHAADGIAPGAKIADLQVPSSIGSGEVRFKAPAATVLQPSTKYFVVMSSNPPVPVEKLYWRAADVVAEDGGAATGWSVGDTNTVRNALLGWQQQTSGAPLKIGVFGAAAQPDADLLSLSGNQSSDGTDFTSTLALTPDFDPATTSYTVSVPNTTTHISLTPTTNDPEATVKAGLSGSTAAVTSGSASTPVALTVGANTVDVEVTADDGTTTKTYTVVVTRRTAVPPGTVRIVSATPGDKQIDIVWETAAGVSFASARWRVKDTDLAQDGAQPGGWLGEEFSENTKGATIGNLINGLVWEVEVRARIGGISGTFTPWASTEATPQGASVAAAAALSGLSASVASSADGTFASLAINPAFDADTTAYYATVPATTTHLKATPTAATAGATIKVGKGAALTTLTGATSGAQSLDIGDTTITVEVTSSDGTITTNYTLTISRLHTAPEVRSGPATSQGSAAINTTILEPPAGFAAGIQVKLPTNPWVNNFGDHFGQMGIQVDTVRSLGADTEERTILLYGYTRNTDYEVRALLYDPQTGAVHKSWANQPVVSAAVTVTTWDLPGKPTAVSAAPVPGNAAQLTVSWTPPTDKGGADIIDHQIRWRVKDSDSETDLDQPGEWSTPVTATLDATSYVIKGLTGATAYEVQVRAHNGIDPGSDWSETAEATTTEPPNRTVSIDSAVSAAEGANAVLTVTLGEAAPSTGVAVSVAYDYSGSSATAADTGTTPATLTVANGATTASLTIPISDDALVEGAETFTATISTAQAGWSVATGASTATVTITDDEAAEAAVAFGTDAAASAEHTVSAAEGAGSVDVPVTVNHLPQAAVTFSVEVLTGGTANDPGDYSITTKSVTFTPGGAKTQNLTVTLNDNDVDVGAAAEPTIKLRIAAAGAPVDDLGDHYARHATGSLATVTISDDDTAAVTVSVSALDAVVGETATYTVKLDTQPSAEVEVAVASGDIAVATATPAVLTFTSTNFAVAQTVNVAGVARGSTTVTHTLTTADTIYTALSVDSVAVSAIPPIPADTLRLGSVVAGDASAEAFVEAAPGVCFSDLRWRVVDTDRAEASAQAGPWNRYDTSGGRLPSAACPADAVKSVVFPLDSAPGLINGQVYEVQVQGVVDATDSLTPWSAGIEFTPVGSVADAVALSALVGTTSTDGSTFDGTLTLNPVFNSDATYYIGSALDGAVTHLKFTPTVETSGATVEVGLKGGTLAAVASGSSSAALPVGIGYSSYVIKVTAQDTNSSATYEVDVVRLAAPTNTAVTVGALNGTAAIRLSVDNPTRPNHVVRWQVKLASESWGERQDILDISPASLDGGDATLQGDWIGGFKLGAELEIRAHYYAVGQRGFYLQSSIGAAVEASSDPITVTAWDVPAAPTAVTAATVADKAELAVAWTAPTDTGGTGAAITGYKVRWRIKDTDSGTSGNQEGPWNNASGVDAAGTTYTATAGLAATTTYEVQVRALNGIDPGSAWSALADGTTAAEPDTVTLVSNLGQSPSNNVQFASNALAGRVVAGGFVAGDNASGYVLEGIAVKTGIIPASVNTPANRERIKGELWSWESVQVDGSTVTRPKEKIVSLVTPAMFVRGGNVFSAPEGTVLEANTNYFFVMYLDVSDRELGRNVTLEVTASDAEDSGAASGWSLSNGYQRIDNSYTPPGTWEQQTDAALQLAVSGYAVPTGDAESPTSLTLTTNAASGTVAEDGGPVTVTAALDVAATADVVVTLAAGDASTAASSDYTLPAAFTIATDATSATAVVQITDDALDEDDETLVLTATAGDLSVTDVTLTITDNDTAGV